MEPIDDENDLAEAMEQQVDQFFQDLTQDGVLPEEGLLFLQQSNQCGYTFLRIACVLYYPSIMDRYVSIISTHPHQGPSRSYIDYYVKADFSYYMLGLVKDVRISLGDTYHQDQATIHWDLNSSTVISFCHVKSSRQKLHGISSNLHSCNHVFSLKQVNVQLVSFPIRFLQDKDQGVVWKLSFHFTFHFTCLFTFGKKHYHFTCSGYNHKSILYPIEYDDGKQEHCILAMAIVLQKYDGHVQKNHQSKFVPSHMQFEEQHHNILVQLHFSNEMDLSCWTKQVIIHIKTSVVFFMTIYVYEPFKVHGGVLLIDDIVEKQQHP